MQKRFYVAWFFVAGALAGCGDGAEPSEAPGPAATDADENEAAGGTSDPEELLKGLGGTGFVPADEGAGGAPGGGEANGGRPTGGGGSVEPETGSGGTSGTPPMVRPGCEEESFDGHIYALCRDEKVLFPDARRDCESMNMALVRIDSAEENEWIYSTFYSKPTAGDRDSDQMWLGGSDSDEEGTWRWLIGDEIFWRGTASGSPAPGLYTNWGRAHGLGEQNQPNDSHNESGEDCMVIRAPHEGEGGKWTDIGCGPDNDPSENANRHGWYTCEEL